MEYMFISCFAFLTVIAIAFFMKPKVKNEDTVLYSIIVVANLVGIIIDLVQYELIKIGSPEVISIFLGKLFLIYIFFWTYLLSVYVINIGKAGRKENEIINLKAINNIIKVLFIIGIVCVSVAPISIIHEGNEIYTKGLAVKIGYIVVMAYIIIDTIGTITNINKVTEKKKYIPFFVFMGIGLIATIVQAIHPYMLLITPVEALITVLTYFFIENPDVRMIEQLEISKEQADKANNAKSEFLSSMSHEIRTPLNAIVGFSESLKDDDLTEVQREKVDDIIMASNSLLEIVNGILDISKIEANKLEIINKEYDIKSVLDELLALTKARMGDSALDLRVSIDPTIPRVLYGDNIRLKQIVLNLLTNAVKYTKEGYISFTVSQVTKDNICRLIFAVEDSGIGIKEEALPRLFSKFDRLNVEKSLTIEGTGLGLAITKKLVELMHGRIVVQSVYGKGSKFTVAIDQRIISVTPPEVKETTVSESKAIDVKGSKVLIIDDNELNIKVASTLLKKYGLIIDSCTNGAEALMKLLEQRNQYDIVFLDDMMPRISGREVMAKLKADASYSTPTVALTANAIEGMKEEYLKCGFDDYLSKPIEKNELERVLNKFINKQNAQEANAAVKEEVKSALPYEDFGIILPKTIESPKPVEEPKEKKKILIVDDDNMNLKVVSTMLKNYDYDLTLVSSGSEAIMKVIEGKFDLILMDDMMPELDGSATLDQLKEIEDFNTPVVLLTANSEDEVRNKIEEHGFSSYLGKPINKEALNDMIIKYL